MGKGVLIGVGLLFLLPLVGLLAITKGSEEYYLEAEEADSSLCLYCGNKVYNPYLQTHIQLKHPQHATYQSFTVNDSNITLYKGEIFDLIVPSGSWNYSFKTPAYSLNPDITLINYTANRFRFKANKGGYSELTMDNGIQSYKIIVAVNPTPMLAG